MDELNQTETMTETETGPDMGPMPEIPPPTEALPTKKVAYLQDCLRKLLKAIVGQEPPEIVPAEVFTSAGPRWTEPVPAKLAAVVMQLAAVIERVAQPPVKQRFASVTEDSFTTATNIDLLCTAMELAAKDKKLAMAVKDVLMGKPPEEKVEVKEEVEEEPPSEEVEKPAKPKSMIERAA